MRYPVYNLLPRPHLASSHKKRSGDRIILTRDNHSTKTQHYLLKIELYMFNISWNNKNATQWGVCVSLIEVVCLHVISGDDCAVLIRFSNQIVILIPLKWVDWSSLRRSFHSFQVNTVIHLYVFHKCVNFFNLKYIPLFFISLYQSHYSIFFSVLTNDCCSIDSLCLKTCFAGLAIQLLCTGLVLVLLHTSQCGVWKKNEITCFLDHGFHVKVFSCI